VSGAPADYTGLGAEAWDLLTEAHDPGDVARYRALLDEHGVGGPLRVLDVGCGTGRLLRPLCAAGHRVVGVDCSADQVERCRARLRESGLEAVVLAADVARLDLAQRFDAAIVPCGTLQLLPDGAAAQRGLERIAAHLDPGGLLAMTMYLSGPEIDADPGQIGMWRLRGSAPAADGVIVRKDARIDSVDREAQLIRATIRYQRVAPSDARILAELEVAVAERWYTIDQTRTLLERAGFDQVSVFGGYVPRPATRADHTLMFTAIRP